MKGGGTGHGHSPAARAHRPSPSLKHPRVPDPGDNLVITTWHNMHSEYPLETPVF
jgi:hypothetical protein